MSKPLPAIDDQWTLFLDRDGVINVDNIHGYIMNWEEFKFFPGVLEAIKLLSKLFPRIVLVTNQRGVGRGLMPESELLRIHSNMKSTMEEAGGRMDLMLFCKGTESSDPCRKPNPGMAFKAKEQFPEIDFSKSIMVGNTKGDMEFARNIGAFSVYIHNREDKVPKDETVDYRADSLLDLAKALESR